MSLFFLYSTSIFSVARKFEFRALQHQTSKQFQIFLYIFDKKTLIDFSVDFLDENVGGK